MAQERPIASLRSGLQGELAARISELIRSRSEGFTGRIREAVLSRELGVSRTPIRAALQHLVSEGVLEPHARGGYTVLKTPSAVREASHREGPTPSLYGQMLRDIILNEVPDPATESAMMRRYNAGRGEIVRVVRRLVREGLAEPLPGHGWMMLRFDWEQLDRSYHLRSILEPALVIDREYVPERSALEGLRSDHIAALATLSPELPWQDLFALDATFHETIAGGSQNELIVDIIRRQNRLRRLAEYVSYSRLERIRESMNEHVAIIDALLRGDNGWASALLRQHLNVSSIETAQHFARDLDAIRAAPEKLQELR
jgi:DNA-binding GntR family transcriptional regulator